LAAADVPVWSPGFSRLRPPFSARCGFLQSVFAGAPPPEGGTPNLNPGVIPLLAVVADRIFSPHALGFRTAPLREVFRRTAPSPLCPKPHVTMMHRIVVNIIDRAKKCRSERMNRSVARWKTRRPRVPSSPFQA
jgi:hypothetical protein